MLIAPTNSSIVLRHRDNFTYSFLSSNYSAHIMSVEGLHRFSFMTLKFLFVEVPENKVRYKII
jgi:hypothetical protein